MESFLMARLIDSSKVDHHRMNVLLLKQRGRFVGNTAVHLGIAISPMSGKKHTDDRRLEPCICQSAPSRPAMLSANLNVIA